MKVCFVAVLVSACTHARQQDGVTRTSEGCTQCAAHGNDGQQIGVKTLRVVAAGETKMWNTNPENYGLLLVYFCF
jgi:hypothetical protein